MCPTELQAGDISAVGRIAVQLFSGRPLYASPDDDCFWEWQVGNPHVSESSISCLHVPMTLQIGCASRNVLMCMHRSRYHLLLLLLCSQLMNFASDISCTF